MEFSFQLISLFIILLELEVAIYVKHLKISNLYH